MSKSNQKQVIPYILVFLLGIVLCHLQISLFNFTILKYIDFPFIITVAFSLYMPKKFFPLVFMVLGLYLDAMVGRFSCYNALIFFSLSLILVYFGQNVRRDTFIIPFITFFIAYVSKTLLDIGIVALYLNISFVRIFDLVRFNLTYMVSDIALLLIISIVGSRIYLRRNYVF